MSRHCCVPHATSNQGLFHCQCPESSFVLTIKHHRANQRRRSPAWTRFICPQLVWHLKRLQHRRPLIQTLAQCLTQICCLPFRWKLHSRTIWRRVENHLSRSMSWLLMVAVWNYFYIKTCKDVSRFCQENFLIVKFETTALIIRGWDFLSHWASTILPRTRLVSIESKVCYSVVFYN